MVSQGCKALCIHHIAVLLGKVLVLKGREDINSSFVSNSSLSWQLRWDQNRVIHYSGGNLVAVSSNRKVHLLDLVQVKVLPTEFRGHAGSIRSLFLCEEENFLLSGSYDLSIR